MYTYNTFLFKTCKGNILNYKYFYQTEIGKIFIGESKNFITFITFSEENIPTDYKKKETHLIKQCIKEIYEYLEGNRKYFSIKISEEGTKFQKKVWNELKKIPYGETRSYQDIAISIGNIKASRAIGNTNNKNPIAIIIPCHRVIAKNGNLSGYAGGSSIKKFLLNLEQKHLI